MDFGTQPVFSEVRDVQMGLLQACEIGAAATSKAALPVVDNFANIAPPILGGAQMLLTEWDHRLEKKRIAREYDAEIGARLRKPGSEVSTRDMERVAAENPVIGEALSRSTKKRNLSIAVTIASVIAATALAHFLVPVLLPALSHTALAGSIASALGHHIVPAVVGKFMAGAAAGILGFLGVEMPLGKIGEKVFGLEEPAIKRVKRNPGLQRELSVSSQITYLSELQAERKLISQEQVINVFISANPGLDRQIKVRYGDSFEKLSDRSKIAALQDLGPQFSLRELTEDINLRYLRVQELAFMANGQVSGLQSLGNVQRENARLQQRVNDLSAQLDQFYAQQRPVRKMAMGEPMPVEWQQRIIEERQQQANRPVSLT